MRKMNLKILLNFYYASETYMIFLFIIQFYIGYLSSEFYPLTIPLKLNVKIFYFYIIHFHYQNTFAINFNIVKMSF